MRSPVTDISLSTPSLRRGLDVLSALLLAALLFFGGYAQKCAAQNKRDKPEEEMEDFRADVQSYFKAKNFRALEDLVAEVRSGPTVFASGAWRLSQFYGGLGYSRKIGDAVWQLDESTFQEWEKAFPQSITARIAHAQFLTSYAWEARGGGFADTVTNDGWKLFGERLNAAAKILADAREMQPRCPMWWRVELTVALGQGWTRTQEARLFEEAKKAFPQYWGYDTAHALFLLPRWYGGEGDWEKSAEQEMQRPEGLGAEGYARVVASLISYYGNIFRESHASWPKTKEGFEQIHKKYPTSLQNLSLFFQLACLGGDRELAQQLLEELDTYVGPGMPRDSYEVFKNWALTGQPAEGVSFPKPR